MKKIAHISDLHFGREDPDVAEGLIEDISRMKPDLVINSGDFTQRARRSQYRAASAYMKRLPQPQISVPGNHDIPLFDAVRRFLDPLGRYRAYITENLLPKYMDEEMTVVGINTARSLTWKSGRVSIAQMEEVEQLLSGIPASLINVVVTHHPFIPPPGEDKTGVDLVGRASRVLTMFDRCGVDLLLAGHLHHGYTGDIRTFYPSTTRSMVVAQAGTAISKRVRNEVNGYNFIRLKAGRIEIESRRWSERMFSEDGKVVFSKRDNQWLPSPEAAFHPTERSGEE